MAEQRGQHYYNSPYKFNGKELDEETGLYYYGARYYDPKVSIWLSVDPLAEKYPNVSPYVYCLNNPVRFIDPDGRKVAEPPVIWIKDVKGSHNIFKFATGLRYQTGDNYFDVFGHANHKLIIGLNSKGENVNITTPEQFVNLMNESSKEFKAAMEKGDLITVKLHACNSGADDDNKGNSIDNPIGQQISEAYPNIVVVAPDGKVVTTPGKDPKGKDESKGNAYEKGVYDYEEKGSYRVFFKGKEISRDYSVGLPPPPPKKEENITNNNCQNGNCN
ncbi:RHS repeat-associated core domain-containing protein [Flavobacterium sp.]|jgi:RHS repeat-associated protein|uniref:RHS repeat-associated core domain-containing protein n=1 Tax=Flavobacterium sp. TaxID=239 RepID=UPI0022C8C11D|nr:RHS repeat-associated core domain-containing protein [Flavobacterium sp.]MCZ8297691.1 RHS repeat-associated core domain-containing protein [Flavobacterium sp.]